MDLSETLPICDMEFFLEHIDDVEILPLNAMHLRRYNYKTKKEKNNVLPLYILRI